MITYPQWQSRGATFSSCRRYRYLLWRTWNDLTSTKLGTVLWVMLNPSTADELVFDPTVRRCFLFTRAWGYRSMEVVNIFGLRSTDPRELYRSSDPVGPDNDKAIMDAAYQADLIVCAWGNHGRYRNRGLHVREHLKTINRIQLHVLGLTGMQQPRHPLYVRGDLKPEVW